MNSSPIKAFIKVEPASVQKPLREMYRIVREAAPEAAEKIAWGMPTLWLEGNLLHFAAFKNHLSLFPGPDAIEHFQKQLGRFETSKGTIQFQYGQKLPVALISRIAKFCVRRNQASAAAKKAAKKAKKKMRRSSFAPSKLRRSKGVLTSRGGAAV